MAMYLKGVAIICLAIVPVTLCYDDIDAFMTGRQVREIFQADAGSVPEHQIVEINFLERNKRDLFSAVTRITVRAFGNDIELWLRPTENVLFGANTPVYSAWSDLSRLGEVQFIQDYNAMSGLGQLLEDPIHLASLVIGTDNFGRTRVNGHIAKRGLSIKSLPHDVVTEYLRKRRSINDHDSSNSTFHVIYKTNEHFGKNNPIADIDQTMLNERMARSTVDIPSVLYPEILVFVEYSMFTAHGSNSATLLEYLLAFWNGVDLKYRTLENPKVRLHISHVVIGKDAAATPYISKNMITEKALHQHNTYYASFQFFNAIKDTFPLTSYDIAVTLTRLDIDLGNSTMGFSCPAGACNNNYFDMYGVAFARDNGAFMGVQFAAHELGHTLGMFHDNATIHCERADGYLMAYSPWYTTNSSSFSPCSIQQLESHINNQKLTCLYNVPQSLGDNLPKLMPGKMKNLEAQCRAEGFGLPCNVHDEDICVNFSCIKDDGSCWRTIVAALDGTTCGDNSYGPPKFCLNNRCVALNGSPSNRYPTLPPPYRYPTQPPPYRYPTQPPPYRYPTQPPPYRYPTQPPPYRSPTQPPPYRYPIQGPPQHRFQIYDRLQK